MIYTVGMTHIYDPLLGTQGFSKSKGGSVWRTVDDVKNYYDGLENVWDEYSIYSVDADWDKDVVEYKYGYWLIRDAPIVSKVV